MEEKTVIELLDRLADFQAHRDLIESDKRALLDDVKVPAEVEALVQDSLQQVLGVDAAFAPALDKLKKETQARLAAIAIPEEIKAALAEIDRQRDMVTLEFAERNSAILQEIQNTKREIQEETQEKTRGVYAALAQRKAEIEAEFAGKAGAVDLNIAALTSEIKAAVVDLGFSVSGSVWQAVYVKPKKTWIPARLDRFVENHPEIKDCFTVGDPSVSIRKI
jgi:hypothetical protein